VPIIAQSAYTSERDKEKAFSSGCNDFITKPIGLVTFNKILKEYLI